MNKFIIVFIFVVAAYRAAEVIRGEEFEKLLEECKTEAGATDDDAKAIMRIRPLTTKNGWCMYACIKKKIGMMDADNKTVMKKMKEELSQLKAKNADLYEKIVTFMQECKEKVEADAKNLVDQCTAAEAFGTCCFAKRAAAGLL